jgi:hypothetical protein
VHLLQWDVARPVFESSEAGRRYPVVDGVTHPIVRKAVGLWARGAVVEWHRRHRDVAAPLIGETPFVGNRLIELARHVDDEAEPLLAGAACRFVIPVPSVEVRRFVEAERERRAAHPLHAREREDAPPAVLRALWAELQRVAQELGIGASAAAYDPATYRAVYEALLHRRHVEALLLDTVLPTTALSVYDFAVAPADVVPSAAETEALVHRAEALYPDAAALARDVERWWVV